MASYSSLGVSLMSRTVCKRAHAAYLEDFTPSSRISGSGLATADSSRRVVKCRDSVFISLTSTSNTLLKRTQSTAGPRSEIDKQIQQGFANTYRHCPWSTSPPQSEAKSFQGPMINCKYSKSACKSTRKLPQWLIDLPCRDRISTSPPVVSNSIEPSTSTNFSSRSFVFDDNEDVA